MIYKIFSFTFVFILFNTILPAQKYRIFKADFSIKERRTGVEKSSLLVGSVVYDNSNNKAEYLLSFPKKEKWVIQDSFLSKYNNDTLIQKTKLAQVNEFLMFKNILEYKNNDFGLASNGFTVVGVEEEEEELIMEWLPPQNFKTFLKKVITNVKDNLLMGIVFVDVENKEINKTFYENYQIIKDLPVPLKISSHFIGKDQELFKSISFRNVSVD